VLCDNAVLLEVFGREATRSDRRWMEELKSHLHKPNGQAMMEKDDDEQAGPFEGNRHQRQELSDYDNRAASTSSWSVSFSFVATICSRLHRVSSTTTGKTAPISTNKARAFTSTREHGEETENVDPSAVTLRKRQTSGAADDDESMTRTKRQRTDPPITLSWYAADDPDTSLFHHSPLDMSILDESIMDDLEAPPTQAPEEFEVNRSNRSTSGRADRHRRSC